MYLEERPFALQVFLSRRAACSDPRKRSPYTHVCFSLLVAQSDIVYFLLFL